MKGTVRLTELITIAKHIMGKKFIKGTSIVAIDVTINLIMKIYLRPTMSNINPKNKQLKKSPISIW